MEIYQAIILGIVQGLTELLPISSSAHLTLIPQIFNWTQVPESFDVALHFGTLLAIGIFFFKDWIELLIGGFKKVVKKEDSVEGRMFWYIVIATIPGGAIGFVLDKYAEEILTKPIIIAIALIVMGIVLYIVDKKSSTKTEYKDMTLKQTFLIGLSQALAFIPGVSRSGVTMTTGRAMGVSRESVAKYSFMLSTPIVLAATVFKLGDFIDYLLVASTTGIIAFILGVLVSFIVGIIVIKFLLEYLKKGSFKIFAVYRVIVGILVIAWIVLV
ncbi:MAG: undecaprenyl-diphosphatase UppP [Clostridia bacterium]|nr:undecaprenyl-diphosphatase UppP [Clostridia bacterium]